MNLRSSVVVSASFALALVVSLVLTVIVICVRVSDDARYELARLGIEDIAHRVEDTSRNLRTVRALSDNVALSLARSFAEFLKTDPAILRPENRKRFNALATTLGVDELHVTDGKGILVRSYPAVYEGRDMAASAQSAAFLPAITNADFALVQEPQGKGLATGDQSLDRPWFQYAGVSRRDAPGIVQIGYPARRVAEAMKLADIKEIERTMRVGRTGKVSIVPLPGASDAAEDAQLNLTFEHDEKGNPVACFDTDCAGYCIKVRIGIPHPFLSARLTFELLVVCDLLLLLFLLVALPSVRARMKRDLAALRAALSEGGDRFASFFRMFTTPLALATFVGFAVVLVALYFGATRLALHNAEQRLEASAEDVVEELDDCVDTPLAFIGRELADRFETPEAMSKADMTKLMKEYFLDEINVVNRDGLCIASSVPAIRGQDQWTLANPSNFCQRLLRDGAETFSQPFRESATESGVFRKYVGVAFLPKGSGYIQLGLERRKIYDQINYVFHEMAHDWHVGESGFYVIARYLDGEILSTLDETKDGSTLGAEGFNVFVANEARNVEDRDPVSCAFHGFSKINFFESDFGGVPCLCTSGVVNQFHRYIVAIPLAEVYEPAVRSTVLAAILLFLALIVADFFMFRLSTLVAQLKHFIAADKERRQRDLTLAKTIQLSALPVVFPDEPDYRLFARMDTAREVGGDFYDFYPLPSGEIAFLIADVSGKGVPAALFMMRAKATLRAAVSEHPDDLAKAVHIANDVLAEKNDAEMFVTAWVGVYNRRTRVVTFVNAGHNPPLVKRADGSVEWVRARGGLALAAVEDLPYRTSALALAPGDALFLYTDGVTEAMNADQAQYGEKRLEAALRANADGKLVAAIRRDVTDFVAGAEPSDDITLLALDVKEGHSCGGCCSSPP